MSMRQLSDDSPDGCIARGQHREVLACGAAKTLVARDSGALIKLDTAAGSILTLPTPVVGMQFDVIVTTSVTSNSHIVTPAAATTFLIGGIQMMIDTTAVSEGQFADGATHLTITMNGSTTGRIDRDRA